MMWVGRVGHVTCGWEGLVSCDVSGKGWCHVMCGWEWLSAIQT